MVRFPSPGLVLLWGCASAHAPSHAAPCPDHAPAPASSPAPPSPGPPVGAAPKAPSGDCGGDGWCWENPLPNGHRSLALWGSAADDVWAVGDAGTILHWDGHAWTGTSGQPKVSYRAVWGRRRNDVWVAGSLDNREATVLHWDGAAWNNTHFPAQTWLRLVGGGDDGTPWVADIEGSIWTWNGQTWSLRDKAACPVPRGSQGASCVSGILRTAGGGTILHPPGPRSDFRDIWDGSTLRRGPAPPSPNGRTFGGARESSLLLRSTFFSGPTHMQHWDGSQWVPFGDVVPIRGGQRPYLSMVTVRALWGARDSDVWVVGDAGQILRFDGANWHAVDAETNGDLDHIWGSGPDDVWATGTTGILHWDGARWRAMSVSVSGADLHGVWGVDECHVWAVGAAGTVLRRDCDGWSRVASGVGVDLWGVGGTGADDVWVVGDAGAVVHFDGTGRRLEQSPSQRDLRTVWARSTRDAWAAGDRAPMLHWDGKTWTEALTPADYATLRTVRGSAVNHAIAVSDGGVAIAGDAAAWSPLAPGPRCKNPLDSSRDDVLTNLWVDSRDDVWATCLGGPTHWDGREWRPPESVPLLGSLTFTEVAASGDSAWFIRSDGNVFQWSGGRWTQPASGVSMSLRAVWSSDRGEVWAVGDHGTIVSAHRD